MNGKKHFGFLHTRIQLKMRNKVKKMRTVLKTKPIMALEMPEIQMPQIRALNDLKEEPCYIRYVREGNGVYRKEEVTLDHSKSYLELYREGRRK